MKKLNNIIVFFVFLTLFDTSGFANAELKLFPTQIILQNNEWSKTVTVINSGDATGVYEVSWIDQEMFENGNILQVKDGKEPPDWSLRPFIKYAPRRMVLKAGEQQLIKIGIKRELKKNKGEFYSHLKVKMINSNLEFTNSNLKNQEDTGKKTITLKATQSVAIPIVWRGGKVTFKSTLESARLNLEKKQLELMIAREGEYSTRGYVTVYLDDSDSVISKQNHVVIYVTTGRKRVNIEFIDDIDLRKLLNKSIRVKYVNEDNPKDVYFNTWVDI